MSLIEKLNLLEPSPECCPVGVILMSLEDEEKALLIKLLSDRRYSTRGIYSALKEGGIKVARDTIETHRRGKCTCV